MGAYGSDTGGSIRQPGSLCNVVGFKPTYGRVSRYGLVAFASSLDQIGPFAHSARDAALLLQAIAGPDSRDATCSSQPVPDYTAALNGDIKGLRVGVPKEYWVEGTQPGVVKKVHEGIELLREMGAEVSEVSLPHTRFGVAAYYIIAPAEASANLVVLRTPAGGAQLLASAIDHAGWASILGTVAGDDTVLVITRDPAGGEQVAQALLRLAERRVERA